MLWDLICTPNPNLFPKELNMLIFDVTNIFSKHDISDEVRVMCPSNQFATRYYDTKRPTIWR